MGRVLSGDVLVLRVPTYGSRDDQCILSLQQRLDS